MFTEHRQDYPSDTALAEAVAKTVGVGRETARRWLVQADINVGVRADVTSDEQVKIKKAQSGEQAYPVHSQVPNEPVRGAERDHAQFSRNLNLYSTAIATSVDFTMDSHGAAFGKIEIVRRLARDG